jgi:hypothetical protein
LQRNIRSQGGLKEFAAAPVGSHAEGGRGQDDGDKEAFHIFIFPVG